MKFQSQQIQIIISNMALIQKITQIVIVLLLLITYAQSQVFFTVASATATPNTAASANSQYSIVLNAITSFSTNFDVSLAFTSAFSITTVSNCRAILNGANITSTCAVSSNSIVFSQLNIASTVSTLTLQFNTSTALYSGSFIVTTSYYQPGNPSNSYNSNSALISITSAAMTCSMTSSSSTVGATTNYTFTLNPSVTIAAGSILQIQFPGWSTYTLTNFPSFTPASVCGGQCSIRSPNTAQSFFNQILTYSNLYPTSSTSSRTLVLSNGRNPASTQSISITSNLLYFINSTSQPTYMTCTTSFAATTPNNFNGVTFSPTNQSISASNTISLLLNLTNPISSSTYLQITYSSDLQLGYSYVTSNQQTTQLTYSTSQPYNILIGNLTNATSQFTVLFMASFTLINAPYASLPNSITFMTQNLVGSTYFQIDSRTISVSATISTITSASASMSNTSIGIVSNITVTFVSVNTLVSGSKIIINIPNEISLTGSSTCACNISSTCSLFNTTAVIVNLNAAVAVGGTSYSIVISNVNNPDTTTITSSFTINTYYSNTSTPVDALTSSLTLTATPVTLQSSSVSSSSMTVAANSTYTIAFQNENRLPANSYIIVTFPSEFPNSANAALTSFQSGSTVISTCTMVVLSTMKFRFNGCVPNALSTGTTSTILIANVINPLSTKPTSTFTIQTYFNSNLMEFTNTGLIATMTTPTPLIYYAMTPSSSTANDVTTYTLSATFSQTHYSGDRLLLTFPSSITLLGGFQCSTTTSGISVTCFTLNSSVLQITLTGTTIPSSVVVSITKIQNNWFAGSNTFSLQTTTNDTLIYYVQQSTTTTTITAAVLTISYTPSNSLVLLSTSTLTITITSPFTIQAPVPNLLSISLAVPSEFTPTSSCTTSISGTVCTLSGSTYTVTGLASFSNSINIVFTASTSYFTTSSVFTATLSYNSSNVATDSSLKVTPYCTSPCQSCTSNATRCTSCLPTPYASLNNLFVPNSTCVSSCPTGYYLPSSSTTCAQCNTSACLTCTTTANTCTSCSSPTYLMNTSCLLVCPNTFYGAGTACVLCTNQCYNCSNATYCLSCVPGYSLNPDNSCGLTCPINYISLSGICTICTTPCATCESSVTRCTSCQTGYILYNNTCILACPLGQFQDSNNLCQNCIPPCKFCDSALSCVSCVTGYYVYNTTQCVAICPSGTYALTSSCANCSTTCQTCSNVATNCTSCKSGLYLYMSTCYSTCPTDTYPYQGSCTSCVSPCNTCLNGAFSCSTCIDNYYLLNTSCVTSCPSTGYTTIDVSCVACPANCITCQSSITCSVCTSGYYLYQGGCITQCPSSSPIIVNSACTSCSSQCATCQQTPSNCLTCTLFYYRYSYTCVQSCPLSYYSNQLTYSCQSGLSSKIVFFPVLITFLVMIAFLVIVRIFSHSTSLPTVLTALSGWMQLAVWCYLLSLLFATYLQPGVEYNISRALLFIAIISTIACNIIHFKVNYPRLQQDQYVKKWQDVNVNHTFLVAIRYVALFTHHKFFRMIYCKIFGSIHLSLVAFKPKNVFFISTIFSIVCLISSQLLVLVGAFYLTYNKLLKDQVFYTAVEALIVTVISILLQLIDIYKPKDYFEDTQFMETKRYLEKVNNDSMNKLEDQYRAKDEGSVDGQKIMGMTSGKFVFTRRGNTVDAGSFNDILFEEHSAATDVHDNKKTMNIQIQDIQMLDSEGLNQKSLNSPKEMSSVKSPRSPLIKSNKQKLKEETKINIFEPIQEEEAEYYEVLKYDEQDFKTAAKMEQERFDGNGSENENQLEHERKQQFGMQTQEINDDNMSLMEYRERRQEWNRIIDHRKNLAQQIFNTIDTKELYKIDEPAEQEQERQESTIRQKIHNRTPERVRRRLESSSQKLKQEAQKKLEKWLRERKAQNYNPGMIEEQPLQEQEPRRRRRGKKAKRNNKELQQIYLQRLAQKVPDPKRKTTYASSKNFKYEF